MGIRDSMSIFAHVWHPAMAEYARIMADVEYGRTVLAAWAGFGLDACTIAHGRTKPGQPLTKWLYRVVLYATPQQLIHLVLEQGGFASDRLLAFARALHQAAAQWVLSHGTAFSASALYTLLEAIESRIMRTLLHSLRECYGQFSHVLLGDGLYVEHEVPSDHLHDLAQSACRSTGFPRCSFVLQQAARTPTWLPPTRDTPARPRRQRRVWAQLGILPVSLQKAKRLRT